MMRKFLMFSCVCLLAVLSGNLLTSCKGCDDRRVDDVSKVPGIYEGEAQILVPENLKQFVPDSLKGALDAPVKAKLQIKKGEGEELTLELVDFKMPMEGMTLKPASCSVGSTEEEGQEFFTVEGGGTVGLPNDKSLSYEYEGKIQEYGIQLNGTIYIVPKLIGVNLVFKGEKC